MKDKKKIIFPLITLVPLILVAMMIFGFSTETGEQSDETSGTIVSWIMEHLNTSDMTPREYEDLEYSVIHFVRKFAHFAEYAMLGFFFVLHLRTYVKKRPWLLAASLSAAYAFSDELHQHFVSERSMQMKDVGIDTSGAIFGIIVLYILWFVISVLISMKKKNVSEET